MNKTFKKIFCLILALLSPSLCACGETSSEEFSYSIDETAKYGRFTNDDYLKTDGSLIENRNGKEVILKGTNAGGYLVTERWMCPFGFSDGRTTDHKSLTQELKDRFGEDKTREIWKSYRDNYWTDKDFDYCRDIGMNVIRLPFSYMSVDPEFCNVEKIKGQEFNFSLLDSFVQKASERGIYTILDLHGAYGSQNGQDHSGEVISDEVDFYSNEEKMNKTIHLWEEVTKHFIGNPAVAGFDLLNEPGEHAATTTTRHFDFLDKVNDAIRKYDQDRILIFEACWDGKDIPQTSVYNWDNCVYSFHHYSGIYNDPTALVNSYKDKIAAIEKRDFNVPIFMGEFNCYGYEEAWRNTLLLFNNKKINWTSWTYKVNDINEHYTGWGIFHTSSEVAFADTESAEEMETKWKSISSSSSGEIYTDLYGGKPLFDIMEIAYNY